MPADLRRHGHLLLIAALLVGTLLVVGGSRGRAEADEGPQIAVDLAADRHAIPDAVYGMSFAPPALARELALGVDRFGGNRMATYDWRTGVSSTAADYFFETVPGCWRDADAWCARGRDGRLDREHVAGDRAAGVPSLLTVPLLGKVAADAGRFGQPLPCSYPRWRFPSQQAWDPHNVDCGNGRTPDGRPIRGDAAGTPFATEDARAWIAELVHAYGTAAQGGVRYYGLGNEPALWSDTHRDLHPDPVGYDELWSRTKAMAAAVKDADPSARTLFFSEWGWTGFFCSAKDDPYAGCSKDSLDRQAHGGQELAAWLLDRAREEAASSGRRTLDLLDLHWYPQGGGTPLDATRSLWDPTYTDPSWIGDRVQLIPRMRAWIDAHYPGTGIALSEYDFSGVSPDPAVQALVQADALGIFARERVDLAARWNPPAEGAAEVNAWRLFRNYDGGGGRFGETWVRTTSTDQAMVAAYAAQRGSDGRLTLALLNKSTVARTVPVSLSGAAADGAAERWTWTAGDARPQRGEAAAVPGRVVLPPRSLTMLAVPIEGATPRSTPTPSPTPTATPAPPKAPEVVAPPPQTVRPAPVAPASLTLSVATPARAARTLRATCTVGAAGRVTLALTARVGGRTVTLGTATAAPARAGRVTLTVRLTTAGRRAVARARRVKATLRATYRPARGAPATAARSVTLRA